MEPQIVKFLEPANRIGSKSMGTMDKFYMSMCDKRSDIEARQALNHITRLCDPDNFNGSLFDNKLLVGSTGNYNYCYNVPLVDGMDGLDRFDGLEGSDSIESLASQFARVNISSF